NAKFVFAIRTAFVKRSSARFRKRSQAVVPIGSKNLARPFLALKGYALFILSLPNGSPPKMKKAGVRRASYRSWNENLPCTVSVPLKWRQLEGRPEFTLSFSNGCRPKLFQRQKDSEDGTEPVPPRSNSFKSSAY